MAAAAHYYDFVNAMCEHGKMSFQAARAYYMRTYPDQPLTRLFQSNDRRDELLALVPSKKRFRGMKTSRYMPRTSGAQCVLKRRRDAHPPQ